MKYKYDAKNNTVYEKIKYIVQQIINNYGIGIDISCVSEFNVQSWTINTFDNNYRLACNIGVYKSFFRLPDFKLYNDCDHSHASREFESWKIYYSDVASNCNRAVIFYLKSGDDSFSAIIYESLYV